VCENIPTRAALFVLAEATNVIDAPVKLLIQGAEGPLRQWQLGKVVEWLNVDLPRTQNRRVDLLGKMADGRLLHIELQSTNDPSMPFRMAEYGLAITRRYGQYPIQLLIYVGNAKLRMTPEFRAEGIVCRYRQVDIRSLDASALLASNRIEDNILAVLVGFEDSAEGIRSVLRRIAKLPQPLREDALQHLLLTCGIRGLAEVCKKELKIMPITMDLSHDPLFASYIERGRRKGERQGLQKGLQRGLQKGLQKGRQEGIKEVVRLQLETRFGVLPSAVEKRLARLSEAKTQKLALAIVDAKSLSELFGNSRR
jgi:predicted transposase YdaD